MSDPSAGDAPVVLEGHLSIEAALAGGRRSVARIVAVNPGDHRLRRLRALARERGVPIERSDPDEVGELASGRTHGGVVALAGPRRYPSVEQLLAGAGAAPFIVMLDGIEDPYNFGAAVRALYAAGCDGVVVRERSWESAAGLVARASAGASELMPTASAPSAESAAAACRVHGLRVMSAAAAPSAVAMYDADLRGPTFVLIGGERRGITRSFLATADLLVAIPYGRAEAPPLGTAAAAALIGFEALRQRSASEPALLASASARAPGRRTDGSARAGRAARDHPR